MADVRATSFYNDHVDLEYNAKKSSFKTSE